MLGLCLLFSGISSFLHAQVQITESTSMFDQIKTALSSVDIVATTTQMLYKKGMDFYDWSQFGDSLPPDSLSIDANDWGWQ